MTPEIYMQTGAALIAVTGLIVFMGMFLRKRQTRQAMMKVIAYQSLGAKKGIAAVKVGEEVLLVGITANDIKLLKSLGGQTDGQSSRDTAVDINAKLQKLRTIKETMYARP